jgi:uncharacterized zinc-type alcohol dehydrogenase-like protein
MVDSCRQCSSCRAGEEQYCEAGWTGTYNSYEKDGKTPTCGGYSARITVHQDFVVRIPPKLSPAAAAPLLCAGITTYSPLRHWDVASGSRVGVVGLGGLGHMAVKIAAAMGASVTVFSTSERKRADAQRLGAHEFVVSTNPDVFTRLAGQFDIVLNTVAGDISYDAYINVLKRDGVLVLLGAPDAPVSCNGVGLLWRRKAVAGSLIGGIRETQEMLDFCAMHEIAADIEMIAIDKINEAYERVLKGDVRYRFVIDMASLR